MNVFCPRRIGCISHAFIREHKVEGKIKRNPDSTLERYRRNPMAHSVQDKEQELLLKKKIAARMYMFGFEPVTIAEMHRLSLPQLRKWINEDEDFRQAIKGLQDELIGALEKRYQYLLYKAYDRLDEMLDSTNPNNIRWGIDKALHIHGKYVDRVEDMTPAERRPITFNPEQTITFLEKGIKFLELTRKREEPKVIELSHNVIPIESDVNGSQIDTSK